jgi:hypothetical protein
MTEKMVKSCITCGNKYVCGPYDKVVDTLTYIEDNFEEELQIFMAGRCIYHRWDD